MGRADPVQHLLDVEEIKKLKARYFRFVDLQQWEALRRLFTDDAKVEIEDIGRFDSADAFVEWVVRRLGGGSRTVHHGHMPEIELTGTDSAHGIWPMFDHVDRITDGRRVVVIGYGHYEEEYRREGGAWRIAALKLTRLRRDPVG